MQRGAIALKSKEGWSEEEGMEGYGFGNVSILRVTGCLRIASKATGYVLISEELRLTGDPSKEAESSSRITIVEYKRTCQILPIRALTKFLKQ